MKRLGTQVQYFGIDIVITMPWVAVDRFGFITEFQSEPRPGDTYWEYGDDYCRLGLVDLEQQGWKETKVHFELEK